MDLTRLIEIKARAASYEGPAQQDVYHLIEMVQEAHKTLRGEQDCRNKQMALLSQRSDHALALEKRVAALEAARVPPPA